MKRYKNIDVNKKILQLKLKSGSTLLLTKNKTIKNTWLNNILETNEIICEKDSIVSVIKVNKKFFLNFKGENEINCIYKTNRYTIISPSKTDFFQIVSEWSFLQLFNFTGNNKFKINNEIFTDKIYNFCNSEGLKDSFLHKIKVDYVSAYPIREIPSYRIDGSPIKGLVSYKQENNTNAYYQYSLNNKHYSYDNFNLLLTTDADQWEEKTFFAQNGVDSTIEVYSFLKGDKTVSQKQEVSPEKGFKVVKTVEGFDIIKVTTDSPLICYVHPIHYTKDYNNYSFDVTPKLPLGMITYLKDEKNPNIGDVTIYNIDFPKIQVKMGATTFDIVQGGNHTFKNIGKEVTFNITFFLQDSYTGDFLELSDTYKYEMKKQREKSRPIYNITTTEGFNRDLKSTVPIIITDMLTNGEQIFIDLLNNNYPSDSDVSIAIFKAKDEKDEEDTSDKLLCLDSIKYNEKKPIKIDKPETRYIRIVTGAKGKNPVNSFLPTNF